MVDEIPQHVLQHVTALDRAVEHLAECSRVLMRAISQTNQSERASALKVARKHLLLAECARAQLPTVEGVLS